MRSIYLFALGIVITIISGCNSHHTEQEKEYKFIVTNPLKTDTSVVRNYVCQIHSIQHIEVRALEKGYLEKIYIDEGKPVKKGQLMFQIMPLIYNAELQRAQAEADFVEIEYKNTLQLAETNVVSANELAMAKAKLEKAKAEVRLAQTHLQFTRITAPFDGIMDQLKVRLGSLINEGDLLTTLSDNSQMWVYFNVPEAEYLNYRTQQTEENLASVQLLMANGQIFDQKGVIKTIEADFNNETGNIAFRATFPNPKGLLRHGETGNVMMKITIKDALVIPQKSTFEDLEKKYVYVIDKDNRVRTQEVVVSSELPHLYIVTEGLKASDKILVEGIRKVRENDKINFVFHEPKKLISELKVYVE